MVNRVIVNVMHPTCSNTDHDMLSGMMITVRISMYTLCQIVNIYFQCIREYTK